MGKILKIGIGFCLLFILVMITALIVLITCVNPNRFKPYITAQISQYTGRNMNIEGDLSWTLYPYMGVKVHDIRLDNAKNIAKKANQKTFAEIKQITMGVHILPLLRGQFESNGLVLKGVTLNLMQFADGHNNWEDLLKLIAKQNAQSNTQEVALAPRLPNTNLSDRHSNANNTEDESEQNGDQNKNPDTTPETNAVQIKTNGQSENKANINKQNISVVITGIAIENANINYTDQAKQQTYQISNFDLQANNIRLNHNFPLKASFQLVSQNLQGHFTLDSDINLDVANQIFSFNDTTVHANLQQDGRNLQIRNKTNIVVNLTQQTIALTNMRGALGNVNWTGQINIKDLNKQPITTGSLQTHAFQLEDLLKALGQKTEGMPKANNMQADVKFSVNAEGVTANSTIKSDDLVVNNIKLQNVSLTSTLKNNMIRLDPISANLYQGKLVGDAKINFADKVPQIVLNAKLADVQSEPLLKDLSAKKDQKFKLSGAGNIELHTTTFGSSSADAVKHLNGNLRFSFKNGVLQGIDIAYLVDSANSLANQQAVSSTNSNQTQFGNLTGTAQIQNGVVTNEDLKVDAPRLDTKGKGKIDLVNQQIDYLLETKVKKTTQDQKNNLFNLYGLMIPIHISGDLSQPSIRTDTTGILTQVAKQKVEKQKTKIVAKIKDKIEGKIKMKIPDEAGKLLDNLLGGQ